MKYHMFMSKKIYCKPQRVEPPQLITTVIITQNEFR